MHARTMSVGIAVGRAGFLCFAHMLGMCGLLSGGLSSAHGLSRLLECPHGKVASVPTADALGWSQAVADFTA